MIKGYDILILLYEKAALLKKQMNLTMMKSPYFGYLL